jgi:hypothetical protein
MNHQQQPPRPPRTQLKQHHPQQRPHLKVETPLLRRRHLLHHPGLRLLGQPREVHHPKRHPLVQPRIDLPPLPPLGAKPQAQGIVLHQQLPHHPLHPLRLELRPNLE